MNKMIGIVKEIDGLGRIVLTEEGVSSRNFKYELVKRETHKQRNVK